MKYTGKILALAMVLAAVSAFAVGCVGPESDDSGINENTDTKGTTQATTQAPTQAPTTQAPTTDSTTEGGSGSGAGSIAGDVSDAISGQTTEPASTQDPARNGRMRGREGK